MHLVLLALGLVIGVAGLILIGIGMISATALANTLVVSGTIALVGGLALIGLASAIAQLRRIAQELEARPLPRALGPEPLAREPLAREPPHVEPLGREPVAPAPSEVPPPVMAPVVAPPSVPEFRHEPSLERPAPVAASGTEHEAPAHPEREPEVRPTATEARAAEPAPAPDHRALEPPTKVTFEAIWSDRPSGEFRREPPIADVGPPEAAAYHAEPSETAAAPPEVKIFKSGVIDGMAYTLYTDGSIEAELAQGTVKFASIDELRAYLAARE